MRDLVIRGAARLAMAGLVTCLRDVTVRLEDRGEEMDLLERRVTERLLREERALKDLLDRGAKLPLEEELLPEEKLLLEEMLRLEGRLCLALDAPRKPSRLCA